MGCLAKVLPPHFLLYTTFGSKMTSLSINLTSYVFYGCVLYCGSLCHSRRDNPSSEAVETKADTTKAMAGAEKEQTSSLLEDARDVDAEEIEFDDEAEILVKLDGLAVDPLAPDLYRYDTSAA